MKKILLFLAIIFLHITILNAQENTTYNDLNWFSNFEKAKKTATTENKPILIFFTGSDWCGICKMLDKDFLTTDKFKTIANKSLILYKADFPRRTDLVSLDQKEVNETLSAKYSKTRSKRVFPTIVLVDANGNELGFIESYNYIHDTTRHYGLLENVLAKY